MNFLVMGLGLSLRNALLAAGRASEQVLVVGWMLARVNSPQWMSVFQPTMRSLMVVFSATRMGMFLVVPRMLSSRVAVPMMESLVPLTA